MAHYHLIFRTKSGQEKIESMLPEQLFSDFILKQLTALVARGFIYREETYQSLIIPRYDDKPQYGREVVYMETPTRTWLDDDGRAGWGSEAQRRGMALRYFSLTLYTTPRGFVYKKDFPLSVLDTVLVQYIHDIDNTALVHPSAQGQQSRSWQLIAVEDGVSLPAMSQHPDSISLVILLRSSSTAEGIGIEDMEERLPISIEGISDIDGTANTSAPEELLAISVEPVVVDLPIRPLAIDLLRQNHMALHEDLNIFVSHVAMEKIMQESTQRSEVVSPESGLLIGEAFKEQVSGKIVTHIVDALSTRRVDRGGIFLFSPATWNEMRLIKEREFKNLQIVGWYRNHIFGNWPADEDELIHRNFFQEPWHVVLIVDTLNASRQFYQWKGDDHLVPIDTFQIIH